MFFEKNSDLLRHCLLPAITKKSNSYSLDLRQQPLIALEIKHCHESILMYPKINKNIFSPNLFPQ